MGSNPTLFQSTMLLVESRPSPHEPHDSSGLEFVRGLSLHTSNETGVPDVISALSVTGRRLSLHAASLQAGGLNSRDRRQAN